MSDTKLDLWLDKHPRIDHAYTLLYIHTWARVRHLKHIYPDWKVRRKFRPGAFYLDHGREPCVLVEMKDDALIGVSMVDGRLIGGCDIWHCGPELVTRKEALAAIERIKSENVEVD